MNLTTVDNSYDYEGFFCQIRDAKEVFIDHYKEKYGHTKYPPSWMITETLSFGVWSKIYKSLHHYDQKKVASKFNIRNVEVMASHGEALISTFSPVLLRLKDITQIVSYEAVLMTFLSRNGIAIRAVITTLC